jgi:trehalose 6-phosphate synthase
VLSEFTGAARELTSALLVNPHDTDGVKAAVARALEMPPDEARRRMKTLRRHVKRHDVDQWAHGFLDALGMPT